MSRGRPGNCTRLSVQPKAGKLLGQCRPQGPNQALPGTLPSQHLLPPKLGQAEGCPAQHRATQLPLVALWTVGTRFVGTIPKLRQWQNNPYHAVQEDRLRTRAKCGFTGGRARSHSRNSNSSRSSTPHQPYTGQLQHRSAGPRDRLGNRVSHPPQQQHSLRAGAGQPARPQGYRSRVDGHNRSLVDQDSTYDWDLEEQWEDEEER